MDVFKNGALNPYKSPLPKVAKKFLELQVNDTFNCKVKHYPDGTQNLCICHSDIFGRNEQNFSVKSHVYDNFKETTNFYHIIQDLEFLDYQRHITLHNIEVFYKSVDNYLLFMSDLRRFDNQQIYKKPQYYVK